MILKLKNKMCVYDVKDCEEVKREETCEACKLVYEDETKEKDEDKDDD